MGRQFCSDTYGLFFVLLCLHPIHCLDRSQDAGVVVGSGWSQTMNRVVPTLNLTFCFVCTNLCTRLCKLWLLRTLCLLAVLFFVLFISFACRCLYTVLRSTTCKTEIQWRCCYLGTWKCRVYPRGLKDWRAHVAPSDLYIISIVSCAAGGFMRYCMAVSVSVAFRVWRERGWRAGVCFLLRFAAVYEQPTDDRHLVLFYFTCVLEAEKHETPTTLVQYQVFVLSQKQHHEIPTLL